MRKSPRYPAASEKLTDLARWSPHFFGRCPAVCPVPSALCYCRLTSALLIHPALPGPVTLEFVILGAEPPNTCWVPWEVYEAPLGLVPYQSRRLWFIQTNKQKLKLQWLRITSIPFLLRLHVHQGWDKRSFGDTNWAATASNTTSKSSGCAHNDNAVLRPESDTGAIGISSWVSTSPTASAYLKELAHVIL